MKTTSLLIAGQLCLLQRADLLADVITLKNGRQIVGAVESGGTREVQVRVGADAQIVATDQIRSVQFDASLAPGQSITLKAGTPVTIRTTTAIESKSPDTYKEYPAYLDDALVSDGITVAPKNAAAFIRLTKDKRKALATTLVAVNINGQRVEVKTDERESKAPSHAVRDGAAGVATGALIGALAGGVIGAGAGALAGGLTGVLVDKSTGHVSIPSETRFTYELTEPVVIGSQGWSQ